VLVQSSPKLQKLFTHDLAIYQQTINESKSHKTLAGNEKLFYAFKVK